MKHSLAKVNVLSILLIAGGVITLDGCSNSGGSVSGNNNGNNGDISTLQIITPKTIYSNPTVANTGYVVINNPTSAVVKNLHYNLDSIIGGAQGAVIDPSNAANCSVIESHSQCNLGITVPIGAVAGSLKLSLNNDNSLLGKLSKSAQSAMITPAIGIQQSAYNDLNGADGVTLNYYHTVINGTPYILVSGLVASANAGNFNNVVLVDSNNIPIPNQQLIAAAGAYTQGKTFSILLPVPAGNNLTQVIKVQTQLITPSTKARKKNLSSTEVVSTATISSTLTTASDIGIVEMLPSAVYLNQNSPEQSVTFSNTGSVTAQLQSLIASNPNIEVIFSSGGLSSGGTTTATLKLKDPTQASSSGEIILTYYNGQKEVTIAVAADQNVNPTPSPSPTPTPTPSPTPTPVPTAGLTAILNPDDNFFVTTANDTTSRQLAITNTGNTTENNFILTLPNNFTLSNGSNLATTCTVTQGTSPATISNTLTANGGNCTVTVTYTNSTVTPQVAGSISIAYDYNNSVAATPVNYQVSQSTANLTLSPSTMNYASITNNASSTSMGSLFTVTNSGEVDATNLAFNFSGTNSSLFSVIAGGTCLSGGTLGQSPASCTIITQFGPAGNGVATGTKTASLAISYIPYTGGATQTTNSATLNGEVTQAPSATYVSEVTDDTFTSGTGTQEDQYIGYINTNYTLNVTYTNDSSVPATGFTTSYTPPAGWTLITHGCSNAPMAATTGTCTDIYTLNSATAGSNNLLLQNVTASWTDSSGPSTSVPMPGSEVYVTLIPPPAIAISNLQGDTTSVMGTSPITFTATISGSGTSTVSAALSNSVTGTIVSDPSPCTLTVSGVTSCNFTIIPWFTGFDNSTVGLPEFDPFMPNSTEIMLSATDSATISGTGVSSNSISYSITTPYIYLAAPQEGAATDINTGITWGAGGEVSPRFSAGSQSGGGTCSDSQLDNLTGLEWAKNGIIGFKSTRDGAPIAQPDYANTTANLNTIGVWSQANTAISNMNTATNKLCGQSDWRLPTEPELLSLVNYTAPDGDLPAWLTTQGFTNVQSDNYWSITPTDNNSYVWGVNMGDGTNGILSKNNDVNDAPYVWPVRSR